MSKGFTEFNPPETYQILDENGKADEKEMPELSGAEVKKLYENMVHARMMDTTIVKLQREGRSGTYASSLGEEATQVGSASALKKTDWMVPYFREIGSHIVRGSPMHLYLLYWMGDERGSKIPQEVNNFPIAVPVSTQNLHAAGIGMAMKIKNEKNAVLGMMGDGATSEGDFHEAMNFAGVFKAPVVFLCQNNQWAISVPLSKQTASQTLAQKAVAYGFDGVRVDGNDVFAVLKVVRGALEKARKGEGPTFVECLTYRMGNHTTADDMKRYVPDEEIEEWKKKDPIERLKKYMQSKNMWDESYQKQLEDKINKQIENDVKEAEATPAAQPGDIFDFLYEKLPKDLAEEKNAFLSSLHKEEKK